LTKYIGAVQLKIVFRVAVFSIEWIKVNFWGSKRVSLDADMEVFVPSFA